MNRFLKRLHALRPLVLSLPLALLAALPARAEYMGGGYLSDAYGCERYGWPLGTEMVRARLNARQLGGWTSELVLNFAVGGSNTYRFRGDVTQAPRWHRVEGAVVWGRLYDLGSRTQIRILSVDLAPYSGGAISEHAPTIRLRARIRNFNGLQGCAVTATLMLNTWDQPGS